MEERKTKKMKALGWWLMLVGSLRLASVWFGFFDIWALRLAVFSNTTMSEVHGRTFGVWTLLTCTLCFLCAFNLENKPLYLVTFLSFIYAFGMLLMSRHAIILSLCCLDINYMDAITVEFTSTYTCQVYLKMNSFGFSLFNLISGMGIYQYPFCILDEY
ncbi:ergosterol biosynthetic protein 28 [Gossypium australe]|uniref:Ergosterol biosynthetic protein 28 n=1 Tax=Gossypium australe TaxID=47621 RepID=A0A5B6U9G8_9ROSI|nr:ergosterol biosynthetic protein 28 [Gossypium australe]